MHLALLDQGTGCRLPAFRGFIRRLFYQLNLGRIFKADPGRIFKADPEKILNADPEKILNANPGRALKADSVRSAGWIQDAEKKKAGAESREQLAEHLLRDYGNAILRLAYSYVHNMADAEDVLQDTLIRVMEADPVFENAAHEKAYLMTAAANVAKNRIEYNKRRNTDELNEELVSEEREDLAFVWEAVKSLPETQREVIHLFYQEGFKTAEIAEILGRKEATIRSDLKRARESLKEILKEEYDFG